MTEKHRDRTINFAISLIITITGVLIAASISSNAEERKALKASINKKADITYVDKKDKTQDEAIKANAAKIDENYSKYEKKVDKIYDYIIKMQNEK